MVDENFSPYAPTWEERSEGKKILVCRVRTRSRTARWTIRKLAAKIIKKIWVRRTRRRRITSNVRKQVGLS